VEERTDRGWFWDVGFKDVGGRMSDEAMIDGVDYGKVHGHSLARRRTGLGKVGAGSSCCRHLLPVPLYTMGLEVELEEVQSGTWSDQVNNESRRYIFVDDDHVPSTHITCQDQDQDHVTGSMI
jgi:hypothetical protein